MLVFVRVCKFVCLCWCFVHLGLLVCLCVCVWLSVSLNVFVVSFLVCLNRFKQLEGVVMCVYLSVCVSQ
jgi:hypothetical protein